MISDKLGAGIGFIVGMMVAGAVLSAYNRFIENPRIRHETEVRVSAEMTANFFNAMGDLTDAAEKARASRRFCLDSGRVFDIATGDCRQD